MFVINITADQYLIWLQTVLNSNQRYRPQREKRSRICLKFLCDIHAIFPADLWNFYEISTSGNSLVDAIASDGLQDDLITIAIDKENSLADAKA
jgi:hypothetical protein